MNDLTQPLVYPYKAPPAFGTTKEIAPGVFWLQMPLPMSLDHINLYLLEGEKGWTVVDTGIRGSETGDLWEEIFSNCLDGKPIDQVICTHMHPDHTGQVGFITDRWQAPILMSYSEYYQTRVMMTSMMDASSNWQAGEFFVHAGVSPELLEQKGEAQSTFRPEPGDKPFPVSFIRLTDGETIKIGAHQWDIITGKGHSPEHVCLYSKELRLLISGDQILPVITSNVSVMPMEPFANPMTVWIESHEKFKRLLPNDILVLPAHNEPFYGVQERLQELIDHHEDRMLIIEENCVEPQRAIDLLPFMFMRELEGQSLFMGLGECIAHIHCLMSRNRIERVLENNVYLYRSIDPSLKERAHPDDHEAPDESPQLV